MLPILSILFAFTWFYVINSYKKEIAALKADKRELLIRMIALEDENVELINENDDLLKQYAGWPKD